MQDQQALAFAPNDWVNWTHGFGGGQAIPGVVRKIGPKQVQIEIKVKPPYSRSPLWNSELKWVPPQALAPRIYPSEAHGEPMRMEVDGFELTSWKHPTSSRPGSFRDGIFYGAVDGFTCTAPSFSAEGAVVGAHQSLREGYRAQLLGHLHCFTGWIERGQVAAEQVPGVNADIHDRHVRLLKLFEMYPAQCRQGDPTAEALRILIAKHLEQAPSHPSADAAALDDGRGREYASSRPA